MHGFTIVRIAHCIYGRSNVKKSMAKVDRRWGGRDDRDVDIIISRDKQRERERGERANRKR